MKYYVITFAGEGIRDGWLQVGANDEEIVRAWAAKEYGKCWSGIYPMERFLTAKAARFPLGKLGETTLHYEKAEHVA